MYDIQQHLIDAGTSINNAISAASTHSYTVETSMQSSNQAMIILILELLLFNKPSDTERVFFLKPLQDSFVSSTQHNYDFQEAVTTKIKEIGGSDELHN